MRKLLNLPNLSPRLKQIVNIALGVVICWGFILVLAQIKPFWIDEWRLLYNLKFKSTAALFGPLEFTQQFPRVYLVLIKGFTSTFDYSYFVLRLPAFLAGVAAIALGYRLMNKIYGSPEPYRYLFLLIVVSSPTFLRYFVQIKQYEMEIFLSLVGIWQLIALANISINGVKDRRNYIYLCISFLIVPFFSYTYPIVAAPLFPLMLIRGVHIVRGSSLTVAETRRRIVALGIPLLLCAISIAAFYIVDVSRVMGDDSMQCFWRNKMMKGSNANISTFFYNIWSFYGSAGSGYVFEIIFSILGVTAMVYAFARSRKIFSNEYTLESLVRYYAILLISTVIVLFALGVLPLGEARLNAFTLFAIAILIIHLLQGLRSLKTVRLAATVSTILFLGLIGNIGTSVMNSFASANYSKTMRIYNATEDAIIYAQAKKLPLVVTPDVTYPYDLVSEDPCLAPIDALSVLKTFPAYKEKEQVPVFITNNIADLKQLYLPEGSSYVEVGNGTQYRVVEKPVGSNSD